MATIFTESSISDTSMAAPMRSGPAVVDVAVDAGFAEGAGAGRVDVHRHAVRRADAGPQHRDAGHAGPDRRTRYSPSRCEPRSISSTLPSSQKTLRWTWQPTKPLVAVITLVLRRR